MVKALVFDISMHGFESRYPRLIGCVTQWLECTLDKRKVGGSSPPRPFFSLCLILIKI